MPGASKIAASLSGRVTRKDDGAAITGAVVSVVSREPSGFISVNESAVVVTTDGDGRWTVSTVAPGIHEIAATANGYVPASRSQVRVSAAEDFGGGDFVLERGGTTVEGTVTDADGSPVDGARIVARADQWIPAFAAVSGRDGHYALGIDEGSYQLEAIHAEYVSVWWNVKVERDVATVNFSLRKGGVIRGRVVARDTNQPVPEALVDIFGVVAGRTDAQGKFTIGRLDAMEYWLEARSPGYATQSGARALVHFGELVDGIDLVMDPAFTIAGRVVQREDHAVAVEGAMIRAEAGAGHIAASGPTDADGRFEIPGARPGEYFLMSSKADYLHAVGRPVTIVDRDELDVTIELSAGATLSGRVEPPTKARVGLVMEGDSTDSAAKEIDVHAARADTNATGAFTLRNVPDGAFQVIAMTPDGRTGALPVIVAGTDLTGLVVRVSPRASISGRVVDTNAMPVHGAYVHARRLYQRPERLMRTGGHHPAATSGPDGSFEIVGLEPGDYSVMADRNHAVEVSLDDGTDRTGITVTVPARDGLITGQVVDANGRPVPDASVMTGRERPGPTDMLTSELDDIRGPVTSDAAGRFTIAKLGDGFYNVWAEYPRGGPHGTRSGIKPGQSATIVIEPLGSLCVDVNAKGARVSRFDIACVCVSSYGAGQAQDVAAPYTLERLPAGDYECEIEGDDGVTRARTSIRPGAETKLAVELEGWASLTGVVVSATSGTPVAGINVLGRGQSVRSDASGRFALERMPAGEGTVLFSEASTVPTGYDRRSYVANPGERVDMGTIKVAPPCAGEPGTLGLLVAVRAGTLAVANVQTGGPAASAGIKVGDTIVSIDGQLASDLGLELAKRLLAPGVIAGGQVVTLGLTGGSTAAVTAVNWQ